MKTHVRRGLFFIVAGILIVFPFIPSFFSFAQEQVKPEQQCGPYAHWDPIVERCHRDKIPPDSDLNLPQPQLLPPPPGVTVLKPNGVQEPASSCPQGFSETTGLNGWRFCIDPKHPESIPPLAAPPIAGILYQTALDIIQRHYSELGAIPGVESVGLGVEGIVVYTDSPQLVPKTIEGLPIIVRPPLGTIRTMGHTRTRRVRPIHEGALIIDQKYINTAPTRYGTLGAIGLSQGEPFLVFPTHLL